MEVADLIAVLNHGRLEQVGTPRDLYDRPAGPFVMSFIGSANRIGDLYIRPHEIEIVPHHIDTTTPRGRIERLVYLGFEVRAELILEDGQTVQAQLTQADAEKLELRQGRTVGINLERGRRFSDTDMILTAPREPVSVNGH
jgi:sulfate/thiosulfate transport system ATP-binding protein